MAEPARFDTSIPGVPKRIPAASSGKLPPLLKWAGGKERELKHILPLVPPFETYYEPFVGGGAVYFAVAPARAYLNDRSPELIGLYHAVAAGDSDLHATLDALLAGWQRLSELVDARRGEFIHLYAALSAAATDGEQRALLAAFITRHAAALRVLLFPPLETEAGNFFHELERNLRSKTRRMRVLETQRGLLPEGDVVDNLECALKSAYYMHARHLLNHADALGLAPGAAAALFFFVRENAYASMFRYNQRGAFNVPYGGISYNRKDLAGKVAHLRSPSVRERLAGADVENLDFEAFLRRYQPDPRDFVFVDPPYDSDFSTYARNRFDLGDHRRLARYLTAECPARFLLVIKNTPAIRELYDQPGLRISSFDKTYLVSFQDRNNREAEHLLITNY